ncbi:hypothetical protein QBC45DRAFT_435399 [Copromyces sp. CBS 386.78]|nr:hypothetical protein QBC45DRAFT_435399 [Copromyces sp. CBS 386.78]
MNPGLSVVVMVVVVVVVVVTFNVAVLFSQHRGSRTRPSKPLNRIHYCNYDTLCTRPKGPYAPPVCPFPLGTSFLQQGWMVSTARARTHHKVQTLISLVDACKLCSSEQQTPTKHPQIHNVSGILLAEAHLGDVS